MAVEPQSKIKKQQGGGKQQQQQQQQQQHREKSNETYTAIDIQTDQHITDINEHGGQLGYQYQPSPHPIYFYPHHPYHYIYYTQMPYPHNIQHHQQLQQPIPQPQINSSNEKNNQSLPWLNKQQQQQQQHQQQHQHQQQQHLQSQQAQQPESKEQSQQVINDNSISSFIASSSITDESINTLSNISFGKFLNWDDISVTPSLQLPKDFYIVSIHSKQQYNFENITTPIPNGINNSNKKKSTPSNNKSKTSPKAENNSSIESIVEINSNSNIEKKNKKKQKSPQQPVINISNNSQPINIINNNNTNVQSNSTSILSISQNSSSLNTLQQQQQQPSQQQSQPSQPLPPLPTQPTLTTTTTTTTPLSPSQTTSMAPSWANLILSKPEILDQPSSPMKMGAMSQTGGEGHINGITPTNQVKQKKDLEKKIFWIKNFDEYILPTPTSPSSSNSLLNIKSTSSPTTNTSSNTSSGTSLNTNINGISSSKTASPEPKGLVNTSNTCFMNVILQTLIGCNLFLRVLKNLHEIDNLSKYPTLYNLHLFYLDYISHPNYPNSRHIQTPPTPVNPKYFNELIKSFNSKVSPVIKNTNLLNSPSALNNSTQSNGTAQSSTSSQVNSLMSNFNSPPLGVNLSKKTLLKVQNHMNNSVSSIQQDAQEFFTHLLDLIHEEFLSIIKEVDSMKDPVDFVSMNGLQASLPAQEEKWEEVTGKKGKTAIVNNPTQELPKSPISQIFSGNLRSSISRTGSKESINVEPFYCIHLDIGSDDINSLDDALKSFMKPEILEGYTCSTKKIEISASKSMSFESLPRILIFHLKRFAFETEAQKLDKLIKFPINLSMTTANSLSTSKKYTLFSVISHHGKGLASGHYTCDILQSNGEWIKFDDSNFTEVKEQDILSREAYLLLYQLI